jgi:hypothetical protein
MFLSRPKGFQDPIDQFATRDEDNRTFRSQVAVRTSFLRQQFSLRKQRDPSKNLPATDRTSCAELRVRSDGSMMNPLSGKDLPPKSGKYV